MKKTDLHKQFKSRQDLKYRDMQVKFDDLKKAAETQNKIVY